MFVCMYVCVYVCMYRYEKIMYLYIYICYPPPSKAHGILDFRIMVQNIGIYSLISSSQSLVPTSQLDEGTNCCF